MSWKIERMVKSHIRQKHARWERGGENCNSTQDRNQGRKH